MNPQGDAIVREQIDLAGLWSATLDPLGEGECMGYADPGHALHWWRQVTVPASLDDVAQEPDRYEGTGWFRRSFHVPEGWRGKRVVLHTLGINNRCRAWVNGQLVGENPDAHLGFELPIGQALRYGEDNVLVLCVDNTRRQDTIPGVGVGWHPYGGLLREIELEAMDPLHLQDVSITAIPAAAGGEFTLEARVRNDRAQALDGVLKVGVFSAEGTQRLMAQATIRLEAGAEGSIQVSGIVPEALAWSPEAPHLYTALVQIYAGDALADARQLRFGFRQIVACNGMLFLNGKPLYLTGFNRHEDSPTRDMCADHPLARADLVAMKEMGCNFVRLCHYPQHPRTLDLCDELGLAAMCEIPLYWWRGYSGGEGNYDRVLATARRQLEKLIRRDRNHPAVLFWSVSNETHTQHPEVVAGNEQLIYLAHALDPTRLAIHVSDHWNLGHGRQDRFVADDVICVNGYPDPASGAAYWAEELERLHQTYPGKPILVTEFGEQHEKQTPSIQAAFAGAQAPYVCGLTIWCWADHRWPVELAPFSLYGVLTRDRRPKPSVEVVRQGFAEARKRFAARVAGDLLQTPGS